MKHNKLLVLLTSLLSILQSGRALSVRDLPEKPEDGDLWVLLVAGSNGWFNYRHQADICHAYQIVHAHGVPDDRIIVMMYDDIAYNKENPTPGQIINQPNGTDVYHGVVKDYVCASVRPDLFLQVLQGEKVDGIFGSGKTLESGPNDNVFVYFTDHGAKGLVAFGESVLKATDLNKAIKNMYDNKKYKNMVFYVEACESGSMFKNLLPSNMNVFATTASNATTSSFACYFDEKRKTFLADVYSIKWMQDTDKNNIEQETLEQQYRVVKKETNTSTVCEFGDLSMGKMTVGTFQGTKPTSQVSEGDGGHPVPPNWKSCGASAVSGPQVPLTILQKKIEMAASEEEAELAREELQQLLDNRKFMEGVVESVVNMAAAGEDGLSNAVWTENVDLTKFDCYYAAVDLFHEKCFNLGKNDYALRMLNPFVNLCERGIDSAIITKAIRSGCTHPRVYGIH